MFTHVCINRGAWSTVWVPLLTQCDWVGDVSALCWQCSPFVTIPSREMGRQASVGPESSCLPLRNPTLSMCRHVCGPPRAPISWKLIHWSFSVRQSQKQLELWATELCYVKCSPKSSGIHSVKVIWDANGLMMSVHMCVEHTGRGCVLEIDSFAITLWITCMTLLMMCLSWARKPWNTTRKHHLSSSVSLKRNFFFFLFIYHIKEQNPNIKWYKMIYERDSLESRAMKMPSAWKSNKHPLWIGEWGSGMYRKPFTGWSCIKQTSPPQIFMGRDLLINLSLSSISLFCIHHQLGAAIGCNHLHFTFSCWQFRADCIAYVQQIMSQHNIWLDYFVVTFFIYLLEIKFKLFMMKESDISSSLA